ncbi:MAG: hypothetical protein A3F54_00455 [Candidatus Kerfeldbacteria bacterium RIFCSPHIGHO2_12_FULL_48_17]|uniref:SHSP domain-containing protein n=1 Tax=Candidatus Kerfeldbacteria bacterium RIFCSPHIGHO2_12_FULL_48_17 TaxID=1798542 RepID=A0A1G2B609_9BACT|nr:MAG: hypothetical protein A3F54_00455 [Candidatus Kerfeldbacteria bacterium RIFCSPHIGHO2_12_FULL_48_17]
MSKQKQSFVKKFRELAHVNADLEASENFFIDHADKNLALRQKSASARATARPVTGTPHAEPTDDQESQPAPSDAWLNETNYDGQLAVDVFETPRHIVIQSTIAGVRPEDLDIAFTNDTLTIKGVRRKKMQVAQDDYLYNECYWGGFSRSIILPVDVQSDKIDAELENGVLTVTIPKSQKSSQRSVQVKEIIN